MQIYTNIPLKQYLTIKLGGVARFMANVTNPQDIATICSNADSQHLKILVLGGGSNIIASDELFNGVVIRIGITGITQIESTSSFVRLKVGAGELMDSVIERVVKSGLSGMEAMSAIPGTIGAAPIQNSGAYGQEIADVVESIDAYDRKLHKFVTLSNADCQFSYRNSIFREIEYGRYVITHLTIKLSRDMPQPPFYASLQAYLDKNNIKIYTPEVIRQAVIAIRRDKLPDWKTLPNAGSFFKNPIVEAWRVKDLQKIDPNIPLYDMGDGTFKIPAGWLIENAGLKGQLLHGMRVYAKNSLVLVNESAKKYQDLADARDEIISKVRDKFSITIQQEPLLV